MNQDSIGKLNLRTLVRNEEGFTLSPLQKIDGSPLCERCANFKWCGIRKSSEKTSIKKGVSLLIQSCQSFTPALFFMDEAGLDAEEFNTFRLGKAWTHRVLKGDKIALVHKPSMDIIRVAEVTAIHCGKKTSMIVQHSWMNHTYIDQKLTKRGASARMKSLLPSLNGPLIYKYAEHITVIYFK